MSPLILISTPTSTPISTSNTKLASSSITRVASSASSKRRNSYVRCKQNEPENCQVDDGGNGGGINRRNVFLGGLYGATATFGTNKAAVSQQLIWPPPGNDNIDVGPLRIKNPVQPPDLKTCQLATDPWVTAKFDCCPPYSTKDFPIVDFNPPKSELLRTRKPAQKLGSEELAKFKEAVRLMKALDKNDPWNFMQQAQIHCAFCNDSFKQDGGKPLSVHGSWIFLPWHRYYIYFWERILGKLIGDPTFAIPFWNWDSPEGMRMPSIYTDPAEPRNNPLYNCSRNPDHLSALLDYKYARGQPNPAYYEESLVIEANKRQLESIFRENEKNPKAFMGDPMCAGQNVEGKGALERLHDIPHSWTGQVERPGWDMGNFHTAARDLLFYCHHANVDRMWSIYRRERANAIEFNTPNWLDASFVFYDEERRLVKCKVRNCLDHKALGYTYADEPEPWWGSRRPYFQEKKAANLRRMRSMVKEELISVAEFGSNPHVLDTTNIRVLVPRPKTSRSIEEKEEALEVMVIDDFTFDRSDDARFDVYIAKPQGDLVTKDIGEFVGSFSHIPHSHGHESDKRNQLQLGITYILEDMEVEDSEQLVVTFVPGTGKVTLAGARIELVPAQRF